MTSQLIRLAALGFFALLLAGCGDKTTQSTPAPAPGGDVPLDKVGVQRGKLSTDDRKLVEAQEWCVISNERLGTMGPPIKLDIKGQPVFICCAGCKDKAERDPDQTLATLEELKAKKAGKAN